MTTVQFRFRLVLGLGALLGIVGCGALDDDDAASDEVTSAIANGRPGGGVGVVRLQLWNGRVLANGKLDDFVCTGTVISGDRILTAGHCVNKWLTIRDDDDFTVLLQGDLFAGAEYTTDGTNWICLQDKTQAHCSPSVLAPVHVTRLGNGELPPDVAVIRFATPFQGIKSSHFRQLSIAEPRARQSIEVWGIGFTNPDGTAGGSATNVMMRAVMRIASVSAKTVKIDNSRAQLCLGDSGGPLFAGPSDLIIGMVSQGLHRNGACDLSIDQTTGSRITPAAITLINNNRGSSDPLCRETIPGTGFYSCS
jgi:trypsin